MRHPSHLHIGKISQKLIRLTRTIDKVDATMDSIREQMDLQEEISNAISNPMIGQAQDDDELAEELAALEQEKLDDMLMGADRVPVHNPAGATSKVTGKSCHGQCLITTGANEWCFIESKQSEEDEEERQLRELQAALAM